MWHWIHLHIQESKSQKNNVCVYINAILNLFYLFFALCSICCAVFVCLWVFKEYPKNRVCVHSMTFPIVDSIYHTKLPNIVFVSDFPVWIRIETSIFVITTNLFLFSSFDFVYIFSLYILSVQRYDKPLLFFTQTHTHTFIMAPSECSQPRGCLCSNHLDSQRKCLQLLKQKCHYQSLSSTP